MTGAETFARRKHQLTPQAGVEIREKSRNMFARKIAGSSASSTTEPPAISIEARLPEPPIITCNRPLPLRLLCTTLNSKKQGLFLHSLEINLVDHTHVRAHSLGRLESRMTVLMSRSNINQAITFMQASDETVLDNKHWQGLTVPNALLPSFETCNLSRRYELVVKVGLVYHMTSNHVGCPHILLHRLRTDFR